MKLGRYVIKARVLDEHEELPPGEPMPEGYEHISFRTIVWMMLVASVPALPLIEIASSSSAFAK